MGRPPPDLRRCYLLFFPQNFTKILYILHPILLNMGLRSLVDTLAIESVSLAIQVMKKGKFVYGGTAKDQFDPCKPTIISCHGYFAMGRSLEDVTKDYVDDYNISRVHYPVWEDLNVVTQEIVDAVNWYYDPRTGPVNVIAHSMGCLAAVDASRKVADKLGKVILLGPPFGGVRRGKYVIDAIDKVNGVEKMAWFVDKINRISREKVELPEHLERVLDEIRGRVLPGNDYIRTVVGDSLPQEPDYHIIIGDSDQVVDQDSSVLPFDQRNIIYHHIDVGHWGLLSWRGRSKIRDLFDPDLMDGFF